MSETAQSNEGPFAFMQRAKGLLVGSALALIFAGCGAPPAPLPPRAEGPLDDLRDACTSGDPAACEHLGDAYREGGVAERQDTSGDARLRDRALLQHACDALDNPGACLASAWLSPPGQEAVALALFARACMRGRPRGCESLGDATRAGASVPRDEERAAKIYGEACDQGAVTACVKLSQMIEAGEIKVSEAEKAHAFQKACDGGVTSACTSLAITAALAATTPEALAEAARLFDEACQAGAPLACAALGVAYAFGRGVPQDEARAATLLRGACKSDPRAGCRELARLLSTAEPPVRNDGEALSLYEKACEGGEAAACTSTATLIAEGRGAAADPARAAALYKRACDAANASGCARLGVASLNGKGVPKAIEEGFTLLEQACHGGYPPACNVLGKLYAARRDQARAEASYRTACERGSATGCSQLGAFYQRRPHPSGDAEAALARAGADCRRSAPACQWLGDAPTASAERAFGLLVDACDAEVSAACVSLAGAIASGRVPRAAASRVIDAISAACHEGKPLWCRRLAFWYEQGLTVARDLTKAREHYRAACDEGDARACGDFARMLAVGAGGPRDTSAAETILRTTCALHEDDGGRACGHLGMIQINRGTEDGRSEGERLLTRACERGDALSCDRLGGFFALGVKGFSKNEPRAADLFERACAAGGRACDEARALREKVGLEDLD